MREEGLSGFDAVSAAAQGKKRKCCAVLRGILLPFSFRLQRGFSELGQCGCYRRRCRAVALYTDPHTSTSV